MGKTRTEIASLSKHTIIYTIGIFINKAVSFIMLPVYTHYLTPKDYGVMELLSMTTDIISMIAGLGIAGTVFKLYAEFEDKKNKDEVISTSIGLSIIIGALTAIAGLFASKDLAMAVFKGTEYTYLFQLAFAIYFLQTTNIIPLMLLRAMQNSMLFVITNICKLFIQLSLNILFLVYLGMGVEGVLMSTIIADMLLNAYLFIFTFRRVKPGFSFEKGRRMVKFGYPFVLASLSNFVITFSDRFFLNAYSTLAVVGVYSLAYRFGFLMGYLSVTPFLQVWEPRRFEITKQKNAQEIFRKVFFYFNIVVIAFSLFISLFVKDILWIMSDHSFLEAYKLVPIIIVAYIFQAWTFYCDIGIYLSEKSNKMALASFTSAICNIGLNFALIPKYGAYGAAWATVGAFLVRFLFVNLYSQRLYRIDYGWTKPLILLAVSIAIYGASRMVQTQDQAASISKNLFLMLIFAYSAYRLLDINEKALVKRFLLSPLSAIKMKG